MVVVPTNTSLNVTHAEHVSSFDTNGSIIYIIGVMIWYAFGFGLILIDDINPQPGRIESRRHVSVYQTVSDLHEQQDRNDILVELKDKERRAKLWQIYYGVHANHPTTIAKDNEAVELIIKQLNDLNERRRVLRDTLTEISLDHPDEDFKVDDSDSESFYGVTVTRKRQSSWM
ncbi:unnamed protein product [Adineta ricciae]|uniref:Uncharacterized protein n=1 Tax=Adineta ricciae TaxID=249248 RepID=A0A815SBP7_ADIRI|nr:unnamed protein product [Adineta ricciae]CAF1490514.1 unnamed protein product [Adineta ricciae]